MQGLDLEFLSGGLIKFIIIVASLVIHEWAHAIVAWKLGDDTGEREGRVTLYPPAHIDLIGTIIFPLVCIFLFQGRFLLGWAKPVPVNLSNFKHPHRDDFLVTIAGPLSNLLIAVVTAVIVGWVARLGPDLTGLAGQIIITNVSLFVFNLLPVPPLDGGRIMRIATGMTWETFIQISRWSMLVLLLALQWRPVSRALGMIIIMIAEPIYTVMVVLTGARG